MDEVFCASSDPSRRVIRDPLLSEGGQTLGEPCSQIPETSRCGVVNQLRSLEETSSVATCSVGRSKHRFAVPVRLVHDRWISKHTEQPGSCVDTAPGCPEEGDAMSQPAHVYRSYIRCTPTQAWDALVDGDLTVQYFYGTRVDSTWEPGAEIVYTAGDGSIVADGEVISVEPGRRIEMTFHARWDDELEAEGPVREVWLVEGAAGMTKLTVELYDAAADSKTLTDFVTGFPLIVSGMKTLLETGSPLAASD